MLRQSYFFDLHLVHMHSAIADCIVQCGRHPFAIYFQLRERHHLQAKEYDCIVLWIPKATWSWQLPHTFLEEDLLNIFYQYE
jgi:hypothetical protein